MAVTPVGTPAAIARSTSGSTGVTGAWGTGQNRTAGNVLVALVSAGGSTASAAAISTPSGWTQQETIGNAATTANAWVAVYTKVAAGTDAAPSFTSTLSGTQAMTCTLLELSGCHNGLPVQAFGVYQSGGSAATLSAMTASTGLNPPGGSYAVAIYAQEAAAATNSWNGGGSWTNVTTDGTTSSVLHTAVDIQAAPSTSANVSETGHWTTNTSAFGAAVVLVIHPPSGLVLYSGDVNSTTVSSGGTTAPATGTVETWTVASSTGFPAPSNSTVPPSKFQVADPALPSENIEVINQITSTSWLVVRGADGTTPVAHTAGFTIYQVSNAGTMASFPQMHNVRSPRYGAVADGSTDDSAAIQLAWSTAVANGGGVVHIPAGTYKTSLTIGGNLNGSSVIIYAEPGARINFYGSGDCIRIYDSSAYSGRNLGGGRTGIFGFLQVDGTNSSASAASTGVHAGDTLQLGMHVSVTNFANFAGSIGVHFDNNYFWTEQISGRIYAESCGTCVMFDNSADISGSATGSFDRPALDIYIIQNGLGDGVTFANGALMASGRLGIYGNFDTSTTAYAVLKLTGSNGGGSSQIVNAVIDIGVEMDDTVHTAPYTIFFGATGNTILNCSGIMNFADNTPFTASNTSGSNFLYFGMVLGDASLLPMPQTGPSPGFTQVLSSASTIFTVYVPVNYVSTSTFFSNIILAAGAYDGQQVTVVNNGSVTFSFDVQATSHVVNGPSILMGAGTAQAFIWSAANSLWYTTGPNYTVATLDTIFMYGGAGVPAELQATNKGNLEYLSNDGNTYNTGQKLVQTTSSVIGGTGTASQNVTGLVTPTLGAGCQYYIEITFPWEPSGTIGSHTTWGFAAGSGLTLTALSMVSLIMPAGTTAEAGTSGYVISTTLSDAMWTGPTVASTAGWGLARFWGTVTVNAAGTLQMVFANATSADTVIVGAGATMLIRPIN